MEPKICMKNLNGLSWYESIFFLQTLNVFNFSTNLKKCYYTNSDLRGYKFLAPFLCIKIGSCKTRFRCDERSNFDKIFKAMIVEIYRYSITQLYYILYIQKTRINTIPYL